MHSRNGFLNACDLPDFSTTPFMIYSLNERSIKVKSSSLSSDVKRVSRVCSHNYETERHNIFRNLLKCSCNDQQL
jgi:hypothetical protein